MTRPFVVLILSLPLYLFGQRSFHINLGLNGNWFVNNVKDYDKNNYVQKIMYTPTLSLIKDWKVNDNFTLLTGISYINKGIKVGYSINEINIPYEENTIFFNRYNSYNFILGIKKEFLFSRIKNDFFLTSGILLGYNVSSVFGIKAKSGNNNMTDTIFYDQKFYYNLGNKTFNLSPFIELGHYINRRKSMYVSIFSEIPILKIDKQISAICEWKYQNNTYTHAYKGAGRIFNFGIKFGYYVL